jgi:hypothetical protein
MITAIALAAVLVVDVPDPALTPGAARTDLSLQQIQSTQWGHDRRHVDEEMKAKVYAEYGYTGPDDPNCDGGGCEIDHRLPRCAGGADEVQNLWVQRYGSHPWNAHLKDRLETAVCEDLKAGRITLQAAQAEFLGGDWRDAYVKRFGAP